ncbi:hypothetical protein AAF134_02210 [Synechococcus lacustris Tous-12m]
MKQFALEQSAQLMFQQRQSVPLWKYSNKESHVLGGGGDSKTSIGTGIATTVLLGGIGLLGFLAKNHDYNFTINGFNSEGTQTTIQLQFKNSRPAKRFMQEMPMVTNLGMGQTRTIAQIKAAEAGQQDTPGPSNTIERLDPLPKAKLSVETN